MAWMLGNCCCGISAFACWSCWEHLSVRLFLAVSCFVYFNESVILFALIALVSCYLLLVHSTYIHEVLSFDVSFHFYSFSRYKNSFVFQAEFATHIQCTIYWLLHRFTPIQRLVLRENETFRIARMTRWPAISVLYNINRWALIWPLQSSFERGFSVIESKFVIDKLFAVGKVLTHRVSHRNRQSVPPVKTAAITLKGKAANKKVPNDTNLSAHHR